MPFMGLLTLPMAREFLLSGHWCFIRTFLTSRTYPPIPRLSISLVFGPRLDILKKGSAECLCLSKLLRRHDQHKNIPHG